jgi:hypothetical protein
MSMSFVITRADGRERRVSGYRYAAPKAGVVRYEAGRHAPAKLPPRVDLRPFMTTVENQGRTSSCVANAVAGAYEYLAKRHLGASAYDVSRLFIYYNARDLGGCADEDGGSVIGDAIEGLKRYGACAERTWPFEEGAVNERPSDEAFDEAVEFLVEGAELVPTRLDAWRGALAEGHPVIFGISLYESFDAHRRRGLVPMPSPRESSRASHGGHAMLCVGYSDKDRLFIVRNSWGDDWGDGGYCYIPYDYLMSPKFNAGDSWVIKRLDAVPADEGAWGDDESILPDLEHELGAMGDREYAALLEALGGVPLETRLAVLFLRAAGADGELGEGELEAAAECLATVHEQLGSELDPKRVLERALARVGDDALARETVELFGEHLSKGMLASIARQLEAIASADGASEEEAEFVARLVETWQVGAGGGDENEDDEDDEDGEGDEEEDEDGEDDEEEGGEGEDGDEDGEDDEEEGGEGEDGDEDGEDEDGEEEDEDVDDEEDDDEEDDDEDVDDEADEEGE